MTRCTAPYGLQTYTFSAEPSNITCLQHAIKVKARMQPHPDRTQDNSSPDSANQPPPDNSKASTTSVFRPYRPPLRERGLAQTVIWVVVLLLAGIGCAAVTVWMFLPSMLPKLPLTFL